MKGVHVELARGELQIPIVISTFLESRLGLAHAALLTAQLDAFPCNNSTLVHGLGTFSILSADSVSPPFASYVETDGVSNVQSLGRALSLYGLHREEV